MRFIHFQTIDSTNSYAKKICQDSLTNKTISDLNGTIITAETQTAGRGRLGRQFYSPEKTGLYMSLIYIPQTAEQIPNPAVFTSTSAVSVCRILDKTFNIQTKIKWVNDVYQNGKKICGILTEGVVNPTSGKIEAIIVGIGINIYTTDFPNEIKQRAGSIQTDKKNLNNIIPKLAEQIAAECIRIFDSNEQTRLALSEYRERSFLIGKNVTVHPVIDNADTDYTAIVKEITDDAKLIVQLPDNSTKALDSGEISIRMSC